MFAVVVQAFAFAKSGFARSLQILVLHRIYIYTYIISCSHFLATWDFIFVGFSCDKLSGHT
jgi:hypothetical protein